jgi:hypothetical protein
MRLKKPAVSNLGAASLAKAPAPAASESALVLDDQIRQEHPQGQRAQVLVVCPIFCTSLVVSVAQLSLSIDSRSRGCGEVGSA